MPYIGNAAYTLFIWFAGCMTAQYYINNDTRIISLTPTILLIFIYPLFNRLTENYAMIDLTFGIISIGIISLLISGKFVFVNNFFNKFLWLGKFSFSIYLLHYPILNIMEAVILSFDRQKPYHVWYIPLSVIIVLPIIYIIYYFTERFAVNYKKKLA